MKNICSAPLRCSQAPYFPYQSFVHLDPPVPYILAYIIYCVQFVCVFVLQPNDDFFAALNLRYAWEKSINPQSLTSFI